MFFGGYGAIHCPLSIVHYQLSIINYPLSIVHYQLSIINYPLSIINYPFISGANVQKVPNWVGFFGVYLVFVMVGYAMLGLGLGVFGEFGWGVFLDMVGGKVWFGWWWAGHPTPEGGYGCGEAWRLCNGCVR